MESKRKSILAIGIFIGIGTAFCVVVLYPIFNGILRDNDEVVNQKIALLEINEDKKRSHDFERILVQYENDFMRLKELFVDMETPVSFFRFLDNTAATLGVSMEKSPGGVREAQEDIWPSFEIRLVGEGPYEQVLALIKKIEYAPYIIEIRALTITESGQGEGYVEFSLSAKVFVQ